MADFGKPKAFLEPACDGTMNKMHGAETLASVTYLHLDIDPLTAVFSLWLLLSSQFLVRRIVHAENLCLQFLGKDVV